jgi:hypothetical protein
MSDTGALRQRRFKAHHAGDHRFCKPGRCDGISGDVDPHGLGFRGYDLWVTMRGESLEPARKVLLVEACRVVDRLERIDRMIRGDLVEWMGLLSTRDDTVVTIVMNNLLVEARQQQNTLRGIMAELRQSIGKADVQTEGEVSLIDQLAKRRADRLSNPSA